VYGDEKVDIDRVAEAIAAYETTRLSGASAYDRFNAGDAKALGDDAREGLQIFFGRGRCNSCHLGPTFTDARFHNVGIGYDPTLRPPHTGFADTGRYAITHDPADVGAFKTPTLRDLRERAPYMHDGSAPTLAQAVMSYVRVRRNPWLDTAMDEVQISPSDVRSLVAFLESLDGTGYEDEAPRSFPQ
jgi:cytochrome c peroxidase